MNEDFWNQFWPQFWGGVASTLFLGVMTLMFAYTTRLQIVLFVRRIFMSMKERVLVEEAKIKEKYVSKQ